MTSQSFPDLIAQATILTMLVIAFWNRDLLMDMTDGNVERLIREERLEQDVAEAQSWLDLIGAGQ